MKMTRPSYWRSNARSRIGYTLIELIVSMGTASFILGGLSSSLYIASRGLDQDGTALRAEADQVLDKFLADVEHAISFSERTTNAVTFTVPDRDGNGLPDTIRYAWSGTPGAPLTYEYNGSAAETIAADVQIFNLAALTRSMTAPPLVMPPVLGGSNLLLVVTTPTSPTSQESARKTLLESWGYTVTLIDDGDSQANYDAAVAANDVAYISEEINSADLGTKLKEATIGVVNGEIELTDEFGFSSDKTWPFAADVTIADNTHYITKQFATGPLTISSASQSMIAVSGTLSPGLQVLGGYGSEQTLVCLAPSAGLYGGGTAAGRRVQLPWGGGAFDINLLTYDGRTLLKRSIEWAAGAGDADAIATGPIAYWMLDDGTGLTATDSVGGHNGTLAGGPIWTAGKLGDALDFDGSDDHLDLTSDAELDDVFVGGATVVAWFRPTSWGGNGYGRIFDKSSSASSTGAGWAIRLNKDNGGLNFGQGFTGGRGWWKFAQSSINFNAWHHIALAYDASSTTNDPIVYLDGSPVTVTRVDTPSGDVRSDAAINLRLGNHASGTSNGFKGKIDDARIYNRMLDAAEIAELAAGGAGPPTSGVSFEEFTEAKLTSNGTSFSIAKPPGTAANDLLVMAVSTDGNTSTTLSPPAGWTQVDLGQSGSAVTFGVWWKLAGASEAANYQCTWSGSERAYGWIMRFTGHDPADPIDTWSAAGGSGSSPTSTPVISSLDNAMIVRMGGFDDDDITIDAPGLSGHTGITMDETGTKGSTSGGAGYVIQPTAGNSGGSSFSLTASEQYRTVTISIAPAP